MKNESGIVDITAPSTDQAKQWQGFGTALKPAHEDIVLAQKPLGVSSVLVYKDIKEVALCLLKSFVLIVEKNLVLNQQEQLEVQNIVQWIAENSTNILGNLQEVMAMLQLLKNGKYELEHRVIMAEHIGRNLQTEEHIHHRNGNKSDNRIENIEIVGVGEHISKYHPSKRQNDRWHTAKCITCGKEFQRLNCETRLHPHAFCSRKCYIIGKKEKTCPLTMSLSFLLASLLKAQSQKTCLNGVLAGLTSMGVGLNLMEKNNHVEVVEK